MLAAGVGRRLYGDDYSQPSKALLEIGGRSLLSRHVEILKDQGIDELVMVVGHRKEELIAAAHEAEAQVAEDMATEDMAKDGSGFIRSIFNPRYRGGPIISLWTASEVLRSGADVLFMDADVLYHPALMDRLINSPSANCFLLDRDIEPGDDPVRLCIRDGVPVEFGKKIEGDFDLVGEWPGFMKMSPDIAHKVADACDVLMDEARLEVTYEEAMRAVIKNEPPGTFGFEDITDIPWIEIDFPADLLRAEKHILPRLSESIGDVDEEFDVGAAGNAASRGRAF